MFGHAHVTTPTCRKYRTFAPPLKFPSYATALGTSLSPTLKVLFDYTARQERRRGQSKQCSSESECFYFCGGRTFQPVKSERVPFPFSYALQETLYTQLRLRQQGGIFHVPLCPITCFARVDQDLNSHSVKEVSVQLELSSHKLFLV